MKYVVIYAHCYDTADQSIYNAIVKSSLEI